MLCRNHYRAFDKGLIQIRDDDFSIMISPKVKNPKSLAVSPTNLKYLQAMPAQEAMAWKFNRVG